MGNNMERIHFVILTCRDTNLSFRGFQSTVLVTTFFFFFFKSRLVIIKTFGFSQIV